MSAPKAAHDGSEARGRFATTRWTLVLSAGRGSSPQAHAALASLCEAYWYPLFAYARRRGQSPEDAADLVQDFFAWLLDQETLAAADPERGRFRSFLLASLTNFWANRRRYAGAAKRGGGKPALSLDAQAAESKYHLEPADPDTPERLFARRWALLVLERATTRLRDDYARLGKSALFEGLSPYLGLTGDGVPYDRAAEALAMSPGAVKTAVHRLRSRLRACLREEISETVSSPEEIDEEIRDLMRAVAGTGNA